MPDKNPWLFYASRFGWAPILGPWLVNKAFDAAGGTLAYYESCRRESEE